MKVFFIEIYAEHISLEINSPYLLCFCHMFFFFCIQILSFLQLVFHVYLSYKRSHINISVYKRSGLKIITCVEYTKSFEPRTRRRSNRNFWLDSPKKVLKGEGLQLVDFHKDRSDGCKECDAREGKIWAGRGVRGWFRVVINTRCFTHQVIVASFGRKVARMPRFVGVTADNK